MRLVLFCVLLVGTAYAQDSESNMNCVERLQLPVYPPLAHAAAIQGSVTATGAVDSYGVVQTKVVGHPILGDTVKTAMAASRFRTSCAGKSVTVVFNFVIDEAPTGGPRFSFGYPNQFWISVLPQVVNTQAMINQAAQ